MPRVEQVAEERAVPLGVARLRVVEVAHAAVGHEEREHRADPAHAPEPRAGPPRAARPSARARRTPPRRAAGAARRAPPRSRADCRRACRPGTRARSARADAITSARPPNAASGRPPPTILPRIVRSGRDAEPLLRAAARDAEAGDHLVEDEQRSRRVAELSQRVEDSRRPAGRRPCSPRPARR